MKKRFSLLLALGLGILCLSGCANSANAAEQKDYSLNYKSHVSEEECCICGNNGRSLMEYYRKSKMIGIVCLNTMNISNLDTRPYSDDGTKVLDSGNMMIMNSGHGEGECSFHQSGMPSRGIMEATVRYGEKSTPDFKEIKKQICQQCLDRVMELYEEEMHLSDGKGRFPEVCLVDFATNELYTLGEHHTGYWIRDFWIYLDHDEDKTDILAIYAPEGKMDDYKYEEQDVEEK